MDWLTKAWDKIKGTFGKKDAGSSKAKCPLAETGLAVVVVRYDGDGRIEGARVDINKGKKPLETDDIGLALFKPVEPDTYTIHTELPQAMAADYERPPSSQETVSLGDCPMHIVRVYRWSALKVRVVYVEGGKEAFLDGVRLLAAGPEKREATTPEVNEGWVTLEKIKPGEYELSITSLGIHKNAYDKPAGMGVYVPPGKVKEAFLRVYPNHWVEFLVVQSDTAPLKRVSGIQLTATLPGNQTVTRAAHDGLARYERLVEGKAIIETISSDDTVWEFVAIKVEKKQ